MSDVDAIVIGAGPNGLVAANILADQGWSVLVVEANAEPGGAVRTAEVTAPGFRNDLFSAFYPLTAASPVIRDLELDRHGLQWTHAPKVLAHARPGAPAVVLHRDEESTAQGLDEDHLGDGAAYRRLMGEWDELAPHFLDALLSPFPPVRPGLRLLRTAGPTGLRALARRSVIPLGRFVDEEFGGSAGALLFAGMALHADLTPMSAGGALFGWMLTSLGQRVGFPVPVGGAGMITTSLIARLRSAGGSVRCGARVVEVVVRHGRARAVRLESGEQLGARRAIVADCEAGKLYGDLLRNVALPDTITARLHRIERGAATVKVDWALARPIGWLDETVHGAGTVHVADSLDELTVTSTQIATGQMPHRPFLLLGQMTTSDPTRSPAGTESAWAYTHAPQGLPWEPSDVQRMVDAMEQRVEDHAPGFRDSILARHVFSPIDMEREDANLVGGDISGGTAQLHQQLVFRPVPGWGRAETPVPGLYLGSASAHPGGAVHGACGANAARAAIAHHRARRVTLGLASRSLLRRVR